MTNLHTLRRHRLKGVCLIFTLFASLLISAVDATPVDAQANCTRIQTSGTTISGGSSNCTYIVHDIANNWAKVCEGQGSVSCANLNTGEHRVTAYRTSPWSKVEDYRVTLTAATSDSVCALTSSSGTTITGGSSNCTYVIHDTSNWNKVCQQRGAVNCTGLNAGRHRINAYQNNPWKRVDQQFVTLTAASQPAATPNATEEGNTSSSGPTLTSNSVCAAPQSSGTTITGGSTNCTYVIHDTSNWEKVCQQRGTINCTNLGEGERRINVYQNSPWKRVDQHFVTLTNTNAAPTPQPATPATSSSTTLTSNSVCAAPQSSGTAITGGSTNCTYVIHNTSNWEKVCQQRGAINCTNLAAGEHRINAYQNNPWKRVDQHFVTLTAAQAAPAPTPAAPQPATSSSSTLTSNSVCAAPQSSGTTITGGSSNCTYVIHDTSSWEKVCQQYGAINCTGLNAGEHRINAYQNSPWKRVDQHFVTLTAARAASGSFEAPQLAQPVVQNGHAVRLDWPPVDGAARYNVYRNGDYVRTVPSNIFLQTQHPVGTHTFAVTAVHSDGTTFSPQSNSQTITVVQNPLNVRASVDGQARVTVTWDTSDTAQSYRIFRDGLPLATQTSNRFVDDDLPMGEYEYVIYAMRTDGSSVSLPSRTVSAIVGTTHMALSARSSGSDVSLSWSKPAGVTTATVTVFGQPDAGIPSSMLTTDGTTITLPSTGTGFMVSYSQGDDTIATSGFVTPGGTCISLCDQDQVVQASALGTDTRIEKEDGTILFDSGFGAPREIEITNAGDGVVTVEYGNEHWEQHPDGRTFVVHPNGSRELIDDHIDHMFDQIPGPPPYNARASLEYLIEGIVAEIHEHNLEQIELEKLGRAPEIPMPYFHERTVSGTNSRTTNAETGVTTMVITIEDGNGNATVVTQVSTPDTSAASSPITNVTTVYHNGQPVGEEHVTVTSPTGGTYSASPPPTKGSGGGSGGGDGSHEQLVPNETETGKDVEREICGSSCPGGEFDT